MRSRSVYKYSSCCAITVSTVGTEKVSTSMDEKQQLTRNPRPCDPGFRVSEIYQIENSPVVARLSGFEAGVSVFETIVLLMHGADFSTWIIVGCAAFSTAEAEQLTATGVRSTRWSLGSQSMASHLSRTVAKKLYPLAGAGRTGGARGSLRTLGPASAKAKAKCFSTQEFNDASRDAVSELNAEVRESHQDQSDGTPEFFSFDSPASPPISAAEIDQPTSQSHNIYSGRAYQPRGVYKAILLGEVGQAPAQKILKSGRAVTILSVGTGGMHLNRRMLDGETPQEFAERSNVQWHRVAVYQEKLGYFILHSMKQGSQVYVEGNLETRIYNDPNSQQVKRIREIAVRSNGRLLFMDTASTAKESQCVENPLETLEPITRQSGPLDQPLEA